MTVGVVADVMESANRVADKLDDLGPPFIEEVRAEIAIPDRWHRVFNSVTNACDTAQMWTQDELERVTDAAFGDEA